MGGVGGCRWGRGSKGCSLFRTHRGKEATCWLEALYFLCFIQVKHGSCIKATDSEKLESLHPSKGKPEIFDRLTEENCQLVRPQPQNVSP